jgi:O-succinylbenzoate synthase
LKNGRVGGHSESKRIEAICRESEIPVWCGGMLESASAERTTSPSRRLPATPLPGDVSASKRYWTEDIIEPAVEVSKNGTIIAPENAGIGFDVKRDRIDKITVRKEIVKNHD